MPVLLPSSRPRGRSERAGASRASHHAVVIAGGGPTGLMLAAELALAEIDVAIVERRARPGARRLARRRLALAHHRDPRSARRRRAVPAEGQADPVAGFAMDHARHERLPHPAHLRPRAAAEPHRAHPGRLGRGARRCRSYRGREVTGFAQDDDRRRRRALRRRVAARALSRRLRRRTQPGPQGGRHRLPRLGRRPRAT